MNKVPFKEALLFWLKLGFISFGGSAGQIAIMHEYLVEKKRWISETKFLHALNYCMLLPGPEAQQLATYTGWLMHGTTGGIVAGLLFILPSVFILTGLSILYVVYGQTDLVLAIFFGIKPAVIAIVFLALLKIGEKALKKTVDYVFAALALIALLFFKVPYPLVILGTVVLGFIYLRFFKREEEHVINSEEEKKAQDYFIHTGSPIRTSTKRKLLITAVVIAVLWLVPFMALNRLTDAVFFRELTLFFTKAALVTFGGAYSVLLYISQIAVEKFHWLTQTQMVDGLALGESTPGPLIMVLAFVGFMSGYHHFGGNILAGSVALLVTVYFTFLPSFAFILLGAPVVEKTQENETIKQVLGFVTAAVAGVLANLLLYMLGSVYFTKTGSPLSPVQIFSLLWIVVSVVAMKRFKLNLVLWMGISAIAGYIVYSGLHL